MDKLEDYNLKSDPFESFSHWYKNASLVEENVDAFAFATAGANAIPSVRMLLFKGLRDKKFSFFSHYTSSKGMDLEANPHASLSFYWHKSKWQVRASGIVIKMEREDSEKYFASRARESQIASAISKQGEPISSRQELLDRIKNYDQEFKDQNIPCPNEWGGYLLDPYEFEFFCYGEHRINDRFLYCKDDNRKEWGISRLQP